MRGSGGWGRVRSLPAMVLTAQGLDRALACSPFLYKPWTVPANPARIVIPPHDKVLEIDEVPMMPGLEFGEGRAASRYSYATFTRRSNLHGNWCATN